MAAEQRGSAGAPRRAICLVVDRLSAGYLGAYGNTAMRTPALDQLASESLLLDQALIDSPRLEALYTSFWQGRHACLAAETADLPEVLPCTLRNAEVDTVLLTDDRQISSLAPAQDFDRRVFLPHDDDARVCAEAEETELAHFFASATQVIEDLPERSLLWLHSRGMGAAWDAPMAFREAYVDEEDPPAPTDALVPTRRLSEDYDPDELLGLSQTYAGQVSLWDMYLGALVEAIEQSPLADHTVLAVVSARGFPLGQHLNLGAMEDEGQGEALYGELVHVPWLVRVPDQAAAAVRSSALVQPVDLYHTLLDWWSVPTTTEALAAGGAASLLDLANGRRMNLRNRAVVTGADGQWAIRTRAWYLRNSRRGDETRHELFVKPDDRCEVNDVADRCPDIVTRLCDLHDETLQDAWTGPLDDNLVTGLG